MIAFISILLAALAILLAIPVAVFFIEVVAAIVLPARDKSALANTRPHRRAVVLIPAHNESTGLLPTLADIKAQIGAGDRLIVVADNCSDDTAAVAAAAGADVIERNDQDRKGKGYALAWGLRHLDSDPPDIVIFIDADCRVPSTAIDQLVATCATTNRPVQSLSSMVMQDQSPIDARVAEFAWQVKNYVRPHGLNCLGLPCHLMGSGMAFPWDVIRGANLASGSIVEDLKLGLDLALAGTPPIFCPFPGVISDFPSTVEGLQSQRLRWEQGHISMMLTVAPRLIFVAITRADLNLLAMTLDVLVPPLSLLGILLVGMTIVTSLATLLGISSAAMLISSASLVGFIGTTFVSWLKYGRKTLPPGAFLLIPSYLIGKLPMYLRILLGKADSRWIRTDRRKV